VPDATRVELAFFNDRLAETLLVMPDPKAYLARLESAGGWRRATDGSLHRDHATRVWTAINWKNEPYAAWEDTCLAEESRSWIEAYA